MFYLFIYKRHRHIFIYKEIYLYYKDKIYIYIYTIKGSHSLLSIFCCNFSWKKLSKSPGISWNFDFEFVWQPCQNKVFSD